MAVDRGAVPLVSDAAMVSGARSGVLLSSFYVFHLTFRENASLSPAVRIQTERGQTVVSTGPTATFTSERPDRGAILF
jgi:hypothetical protein